ncbi:MAG TPA: DNA alkylation repair protein [Kiritimatiellia bacterium]|nr:DNA alkylation repair protein [Kiritimatiellia bacterium]
MRDIFFNESGIRELAGNLKAAWRPFDERAFLAAILPCMPPLGLNERNALVRDTIRANLPDDFRKAVAILLRALGPERPNEGPDSYPGFYIMAVCAYVAEYGIDDPETALPALREMTKRFSAEFAIRPFLDRHTNRTLAELHSWAVDPHPQVRRLASEGSRPRLPWGMRLHRFIKDPEPVLEILELLKEDPELFVRRSVANNLNDIAKDHPDRVVATLKRWKKSRNPGTQWLVKHALRTLLKQGHPEALELLGYPRDARVEVRGLRVAPRRIAVGDAVTLSFELRSTAPTAQSLMIDYVMHHVKANGATSPKVFKLTTKRLKPGESVRVEKRHSFRPIGIRPYYPGRHEVEIQVNGRRRAKAAFELVK